MEYNKANVGKPDRDMIYLYEIYDVYYWIRKFGVSIDELKMAVKAGGHRVKDVEQYFKRR